jgi:uncharacterized RDD family membrane protein YckC
MVSVCLRAKKEIYFLDINASEEPVMPYCKKCGNELPEGAKYCPVCGTAVMMEEVPAASAAPVAAEASGLKLAFWGERFVAWIIDAAIIIVIELILGFFVSLSWLSGWPFWIPFFNLNGVLFFLYWMLMEGSYGQSFGKMVMRLKVTRLDGSKIGMGAAALESVGKAFLLPIDFLIGWILYPRRRQRIFNYISETIVIKET